ncbi:MAG: DUF4407 domain-containing protein [Bacteroidaceae bacterium]|nr:DUF4407 domain-containing protein [Bacteroidaceae bacterium]
MGKEDNKIGIGTKFACFLIGWNATLLKECGESSRRTLRKYMSAIIILSIIWGTIGYCFAERYIGLESLIGKLSTSFVFMTIIICVERYIILTGKLSKIMATVRVLIAMLMAVLGSTIFDQIIFKNDVEFEKKEYITEKVNSEVPKRNQLIENELRALQADIDSLSRINAYLSEEIEKKPATQITTYDNVKKAVGIDDEGNPIYANEVSKTTHVIANPLIEQRKANEEISKQYNDRKVNLQNLKLETEKNVREEFEASSTGFLQELEILFKQIIFKKPIAAAFYIFLFLFLMLLEMLVVMTKGGDGDSDYDLIVQHQQRIKAETLKRMEEGLLSKK